MKKYIMTVCAFIFSAFLLMGCSGKQKEKADTKIDQYVYASDIELPKIASGYMNHDLLLTPWGVMEYASYENDNATGYDYVMNVAFAGGNEKYVTRKCDFGEAILGIGYVVGCDDYLFIEGNSATKEKPAKWVIVTYDTDGNKKQELDITATLQDCKMTALCRIVEDADGDFYLSVSDYTREETDFIVLACDGANKYNSTLTNCSFNKFLNTADGQIAYEMTQSKGETCVHRVFAFDKSTNSEREICTYDEISKEYGKINAVGFFDSEQLIYATGEGIYLSDLSFGNVVQINSFDTQAFSSNPIVLDIVKDAEGGFFVTMERMTNGAKCYLQHYVVTSGQIKTIELALDMSAGADIYGEAIVEFNKNHPNYKIVVNSQYDSTALNTKLIAGTGPVIVDSSLVYATSNTDMWESLSPILADSELFGELSDPIKELMSVNGECYSVSADFSFDTLITQTAVEDMNYSQFLDYLSNNTTARYLMDNELVSDVAIWSAVNLLGGDIEDSFYIDEATGNPLFDTAQFDQMLTMIEKYAPRREHIAYCDGLEEGTVIFNFININTPRDLFFLKEMQNRGTRIVGFPKSDGSHNVMHTSHALMLRRSASEEEKEIAFEFFKMLLSKDIQLKMMQSANFHFSVRNDVLREQIRTVVSGDYISLSFFTTGNEFIIDDPKYDEIDAFMEAVLSDSVVRRNSDSDYESILNEEFADYFNGRISRDMLKSHLSNRVGLFLAERK